MYRVSRVDNLLTMIFLNSRYIFDTLALYSQFLVTSKVNGSTTSCYNTQSVENIFLKQNKISNLSQ